MAKIGIVEDDPLLREALVIGLEQVGYQTVSGSTVKEGLAMMTEKLDLCILDVNLPDGLGYEIGKKMLMPVIFLTARDEESDILHGYDLGAEDYIVKPFSLEVLKRRIKVILSRNQLAESYHYGELSLNFSEKQVYFQNELLKLTAKEYQLLLFLTSHEGQVLSKETLLRYIWDVNGDFVGDNTVSVTINRLKKKLELKAEGPDFIRNIFGMGYVFGSNQ